jgi:transcription antitermination factor NusG
LNVGDRVRIDSGPLLGLEGILTDVKGSRRLVLSVSLLQRSVAVEIDSAFVTALTRSRAKQPEKNSAPDRLLSVEV